MGKFLTFIILFIAMATAGGCSSSGSTDGEYLIRKRNIRIVITDSGLGGLSVMEDVALKISKSGYYKSAELIFVNALFDAGSGYNSLNSRNEKVEIFNRVLTAIENRYSPDAILVACNTLSVLTENNDHINRIKTPVIGIIEPGVRLISKSLTEDTTSAVIILGTETTINDGSHMRELAEMKAPVERVVAQACPHLQSYIEQDPGGDETRLLIAYYLQEALTRIPEGTSDIYLSLNCSHYGYAEPVWEEAARNSGYNLTGIINPNSEMSSIVLVDPGKRDYAYPVITMHVVSKVEIMNVIPVSAIFAGTSPRLAEALQNYSLVSDLF